ncbi:MAG: hypothetical protein KY439_09015 [Actinobacteria bacterium]|nr:hypothetical protein [Actinomycetota bacterium]
MRRLSLLVTTVLALAGACSSRGAEGPADRFAAVHQGVCAAAAAARGGDQGGAQRAFTDVHGGLHELAGAVQDSDRGAGAALLEAKQRAEAGFRTPGAPPSQELVDLSVAVRRAIEATGAVPPPSCSP